MDKRIRHRYEKEDLYKLRCRIISCKIGFFRAGCVETWGRGIEKICEACKKYGMAMPEYTLHLEDIMVKFTPLVQSKVTEDVDDTLEGTHCRGEAERERRQLYARGSDLSKNVIDMCKQKCNNMCNKKCTRGIYLL